MRIWASIRREYPWLRSRRIRCLIFSVFCLIVVFILLHNERTQFTRFHSSAILRTTISTRTLANNNRSSNSHVGTNSIKPYPEASEGGIVPAESKKFGTENNDKLETRSDEKMATGENEIDRSRSSTGHERVKFLPSRKDSDDEGHSDKNIMEKSSHSVVRPAAEHIKVSNGQKSSELLEGKQIDSRITIKNSAERSPFQQNHSQHIKSSTTSTKSRAVVALDMKKSHFNSKLLAKRVNAAGNLIRKSISTSKSNTAQTTKGKLIVKKKGPTEAPLTKGLHSTTVGTTRISIAPMTTTIRPNPQKTTTKQPILPVPEKLRPVTNVDPCPHFLNKKEILYGKCQPHVPNKEGCDLAKHLYKLKPELLKCKDMGYGDICRIKVLDKKIRNWNQTYTVDCGLARGICQEDAKGSKLFHVSVMDPVHGIMRTKQYSTVTDLETSLPKIISENIARKLYFVVLHCFLKTMLMSRTKKVSQLLTFDPRLTLRHGGTVRPSGLVNINILLLDSVSRAHFYRSLPQTIDLFRQWDKNPSSSPAKVFDFELFQAVEGHTAENTHAMFTGKLFPEHLRHSRVPVDAGYLFGTFYKNGYQTMWQEDLCWRGIWGLMLDMTANQFRELAHKLKENFIDHTGITHSSCEVLASYKTTTPFSGPKGDQICYNGEFQLSYFLNYTIATLKAIEEDKYALPILSYFTSSVGHDHRAVRTQTADPQLRKYVSELAHSENTITIIMADHGNTYAEYTIKVLEGRFEMFHPSLFMIVPNKVAQLLGNDAMAALSTNQHRFVTVIDLHHTLMALAMPLTGRVSPRGLFSPISADKTCNDVELRTPNLCVCDGWDSPTTNDTLKMAIAEFAFGELNNMIEDQIMKNYPSEQSTRSCVRLKINRIQDVRERHNSVNGTLITSMDIYVDAGNAAPQSEDLFHVEVGSVEKPEQASLEMHLLQFDRLSMFGSYRVCADKGVNPKLCICSKKTNRPFGTLPFDKPDPLERKLALHLEDCISIWQRNSSINAFAYDVENYCWQTEFVLSVGAKFNNMRFSRALPFKVTIPPGRRKFIFSCRKYYEFWESRITLNVKIVEVFRKQKSV